MTRTRSPIFIDHLSLVEPDKPNKISHHHLGVAVHAGAVLPVFYERLEDNRQGAGGKPCPGARLEIRDADVDWRSVIAKTDEITLNYTAQSESLQASALSLRFLQYSLRASDIFAFVSSECVCPNMPKLLFPFIAAEIFAFCSSDNALPFLAAPIFCFVSSERRSLPFAAADNLARVSSDVVLPFAASLIFCFVWLCIV